ncbi:hypothetical protein E2K80_04895 [Rhodophyticola sp. CCM32]|uniref:DUF5333 domain-containing protein n=1 Tax=Rhodophyticola sp. CCM32 TaxID=2916397 RepID=UPI00107F52A3|nr:DUF5333 domain-containing protein [Rhodophyticola sp. CCM32]QBY00155.1 hypothetical protein E2K80_04895 [Rhodophyticola sp. CCM32]
MRHYGKVLIVCLLVSGFGLLTSMAMAQNERWQGLRDDPQIASGVLVAAIGRIVEDNCTDIERRNGRARLAVIPIYNRAVSLGYSRSEIFAYIDDETEKERVRAQARQWLAERGASESAPETICQVGRDEISAGSPIGRLLREG